MSKAKVKNNKRIAARGKPLHIAVSVQLRYTTPILKLVKQMSDETSRELTDLFHKEFAQDHFYARTGERVGMDAKSVSSQARILVNKLKKNYDQLFGKLAMGLSPDMANGVNRNSASTSRAAVGAMPSLKEEGGKLTISMKSLDGPTLDILKAAAAKSTSFITSIPEVYLNKVADAVYGSIANGNGLKDLLPFLDKQENSIKNWAHNTAMDQTRKVYNGLNAGRMKKIGITRGEWLHSGGSQHPRKLHEEFDGQTFDLSVGAPIGDDDGNDVMPGEEPNCRCTFAPVVVFDDEEEDDEAKEAAD